MCGITVAVFPESGDQSDVGCVLMGAQGYREPQLNQNAKSPVGAIGVTLQVLHRLSTVSGEPGCPKGAAIEKLKGGVK